MRRLDLRSGAGRPGLPDDLLVRGPASPDGRRARPGHRPPDRGRRGRARRGRRPRVRGALRRRPAAAAAGARRRPRQGAGQPRRRTCARPWRWRSAGSARCTPTRSVPSAPRGRARRHRHDALAAGRPGRAVRPGRARGLPVQRRDERRARADRRGRLDRGRLAAAGATSAAGRTPRSSRPAPCSASTRCTPPAAPRPSPCSPTARRSPTARPAGRSTSSPARATSGSPPPSACSRAASASTPRPAPPRSRSSPTTPPTPRFVAADLISQAEHDVIAASVLVTTSEALADAVAAELPSPGRRHQARRADRAGARRRAERDHPGRRPRRRARRRQRLRRRAPRDPHPRRPGGRRAGPQRRRDLRRPWAPVSLGDYAAGSNHVLPTAGCACHSSGLGVAAFLRGVNVVEYDRDALAEIGGHVVTLSPRRGPARARRGDHGPVRRRAPRRARGDRGWTRPGRRSAWPTCRCARSCAAGALRRPAAGRGPPAQRQREPLPAVAGPGRRPGCGRRRGGRAALNRYPDRDAVALRADLAAYVRGDVPGRDPRLTVGPRLGGQRLQRGHAAADAGLRRARAAPRWASTPPTRCTRTTAATRSPSYVTAAAARRTSPSTCPRCWPQIAAQRPDVVLIASPNNPTGTAVTLDEIEQVCAVAPGHRRGRRGVRRVPPARHPQRDRAARHAPAAGRHPHAEQGVRAGRGSRRLPGRRAPPWSTRCSSSGCRTTCPPSPRRSPAPPCATPPSCSARSPRCASSATCWSTGCAAQPGLDGRRLGRQLRAVRPVRRPRRRLAAPARPRRPGPRHRAGRLAAGQRRNPRGDGGFPRRPDRQRHRGRPRS